MQPYRFPGANFFDSRRTRAAEAEAFERTRLRAGTV
jgi:hypothetical protein